MSVVTLICPVYNAIDFLQDTFDSILNQSYKEFDILLVDNASTDGSSQMCDEFAESYAYGKVIVVHNEKNMGASYSRDIAIHTAKTPWVYYMDCDDAIHPELMRIGTEYILSHQNEDLDMIISEKQPIESEKMKNMAWDKIDDIALVCHEVPEKKFGERKKKYGGSIPNRFIRRNLILGVDYSEYKKRWPAFYFSDGLVTDLIFHEVKGLAYIDANVYHYRVRRGSEGSSPKNIMQLKAWTESDFEMAQYYKKWGENEIYGEVLKGYLWNSMKLYYAMYITNDYRKDILSYINDNFRTAYEEMMNTGIKLTWQQKINIKFFLFEKKMWAKTMGRLWFEMLQSINFRRGFVKI